MQKRASKLRGGSSIDDDFINAVKEGNITDVRFLVEEGANVHTNNDEALYIAIQYNYISIVGYLFDLPSNKRGNIEFNIDTALIEAAKYGNVDLFEYFADKGADIHAWHDYPLLQSATKGYIDIIEYLVAEKNVNVQIYNNAALRMAARNGHIAIVRYFLELPKEAAPNVDARSEALINASEFGHIDIVKYLISEKANVHVRNDSPLQIAAEKGHIDIVKYLIKSNAKINANNNVALRSAARHGHIDIVEYLVKKGANIHANNNESLVNAASGGFIEVVRYLIEQGAKIDANNNAVLLSAAKRGHLDIIKYLVQKGVDIHTNNNAALREAAEYGYVEVVDYILDNDPFILDNLEFTFSYSQLQALGRIEKQAIEQEKNTDESILHYIGLILHLLYKFEKLGTSTESVIGIRRHDFITYLTNELGSWKLILSKDVNLDTFCHKILNPMWRDLIAKDKIYAAPLINMQINKFELTEDGLGINVIRKNDVITQIIYSGDLQDIIYTRYETFSNAIKESLYHNIIASMFHEMLKQGSPIIKNIIEALKQYTLSSETSAKLTAFTNLFFYRMSYARLMNKDVHSTLSCLLMQSIKVWQSFLHTAYPTFVDSLYANIKQDYIEVYSGRNMLYSSSGKAISALRGEHVYLTASISTSILPSICLGFIQYKPSPVFYKIKIPRSAFHEALPIGRISAHSIEAEFLIPVGGKLHIDDVYPCRFDLIDSPYLVVEATLCAKEDIERDIFQTALACNSKTDLVKTTAQKGGAKSQNNAGDAAILTVRELVYMAKNIQRIQSIYSSKKGYMPAVQQMKGRTKVISKPGSMFSGVLQNAGKNTKRQKRATILRV